MFNVSLHKGVLCGKLSHGNSLLTSFIKGDVNCPTQQAFLRGRLFGKISQSRSVSIPGTCNAIASGYLNA